MTHVLKNPQAFEIVGKREFVVCAKINGYVVAMEVKPGHEGILGGDRVALHVDLYQEADGGVGLGVLGANHVLADNDSGEVLELSPEKIAALQDFYYGTKCSELINKLQEEAGGQDEVLNYLENIGRLQHGFNPSNIDAMLRELLGE